MLQRGVRGGGVLGGAGLVEGGPERRDGAVVIAVPGGEGGEVLVEENADAGLRRGFGELQCFQDGTGVFGRLGGGLVRLDHRDGRDVRVARGRVGGAGADEGKQQGEE